MRQRGHNAQRFCRGVQNCRQPRPAVFVVVFFHVLRYHPRLHLDDVFVHRSDQSPRGFQRARKVIFAEQRVEIVDRLRRQFRDRRIRFAMRRGLGGIRHFAPEISRDHGQRAARQIAQIVGQIGVVALHQRVERKRSVLSEHNFAQKKIPQRIVAQNSGHAFRPHNVAARL